MDGTTPAAVPAATEHPSVELALGKIIARSQIRKVFESGELEELAETIRQHGVVQPIVVKTLPEPDSSGATFIIIAGERRWRAAQLAELLTIPAIIRDDLSDLDARVLQAIENLQRVQLSLPEQCDGVSALVEAMGLPETCKKLGKSKAWVSKRASVMEMPEAVRNLVGDGIVKDVELANTLAQIEKVDPSVAKRLVDTARKPNGYSRPLTRENAAQELQWAKQAVERKRKDDMDAEKRKAQEAKDAKAEEKRQAKIKERERLMARVKVARKNLKDDAMASLQQGLNLTDKQVNGWPRAIHVDYVSSDFPGAGHDPEKIPESAEQCNFEFSATGDVERLSRVTAGFTKKMLVQVRVPDLTLDQALRLEVALKEIKADLQMRVETRVSGRDLMAATRRIANGSGTKSKPQVSSPEKQGDLTISSFLAECIDRSDENAKAKAADVHAAYETWCKRNKFSALAFNDNAWGDAIASAGIEKKRFNNGVHYIGCQLKVKK